MALSDRIHQARKEIGLSQKELADRIGVRSTSISDWERGRAEPSAMKTAALLRVLKVDLDFLYQDLIGDRNQLSDQERILAWKIRDLSPQNRKVATVMIDALLETQSRDEPEQATPILEEMKNSGIITRDFYFNTVSAGTGNYQMGAEAPGKIKIPANELSKKADFVLQVSGNSMTPKLQDRDLIMVKKQPYVEDGEIGVFFSDGRTYVKTKRGNLLHSENPEYGDIPITEDTVCFGKVLGTTSLVGE